MKQIDVAGLQVSALTKTEFINDLRARLSAGQKTFVTTPYSEFLYADLRDPSVMAMLNRADIAIPDGIGILWAEKFLRVPLHARSGFIRLIGSLWQMVYTGAGVLLWPRSMYQTFPEKISGSEVVWDIARLAAENNWSVYLLGSRGQVPTRAAEVLRQKFPTLKIAGTSNKNFDDPSILTDLSQARPDILLVAFGPIRQEQWIVDHYDSLSAKLMMGLGGTFDYLAGSRTPPPRFLRSLGLEWLYRLVTQPQRAGRIKHGVWDLIVLLVLTKMRNRVK